MELSKKAQRIEPSVTLEITANAKEMKEKNLCLEEYVMFLSMEY